MTTTLRTLMLCAGLALASGAALAQETTSETRRQMMTSNEHSASLTVSDGVATLVVDGEEVKLPPHDGDWTEFDVQGEDGKTIVTVYRNDGPDSYSLVFGGLPAPPPAPVFGERARGLGAIAPNAPLRPGAPAFPAVIETPRVMLGVRLDTSIEDDLTELGLDASKASRIIFLMEGAPAIASGLEIGDVIVGIGDREGGTIEDIRAALDEREAGDTVTVRVVRKGDVISKRVELKPFDERLMVPTIAGVPFAAQELREKSNALEAELKELSAAVAETRERLAAAEGANEIRDLAEKMRGLAERTAMLQRERAELAAQRAARVAQEAERENAWTIRREFGEEFPEALVELLLRNEDGNIGRGRVFIERDGEGGPVIIERENQLRDGELFRRFEGMRDLEGFLRLEGQGGLEERVDELVKGAVKGLLDDLDQEMDIDLKRFIEEERALDGRVVVEGMEKRLVEIEEEVDDRLTELEGRLERIEDLLRRLIEDR